MYLLESEFLNSLGIAMVGLWAESVFIFGNYLFQKSDLSLNINKLSLGAMGDREIDRLLDVLPAQITWLNGNLEYLRVNAQTSEFHGITKAEFQGKRFGFSKSPEVEKYRKIFQAFQASEVQSWTQIVPLKSHQGQIRRHEVCYKKFLPEGAKAPHIIVMSKDIEKQLQAEETLLEQRAENIHATRLASLGEMAAGISHEIRNPLTIISGANLLIRKELKRGSEIRVDRILEKTEQIAKTINRISLIVEGMRKMARGDDQGGLEWFPLTTILEETLSYSEDKLFATKIDLKVLIERDDLEIHGNSAQVSQVLLNLISNARDVLATQDDRRIRIRARLSQEGKLWLQVTDSGPGVKDLEKLFTPFYTTKSSGQGTGLGLSISRKIIENHEGHLTYRREEGMSIFEITFPASRVRIAKSVPFAA